MKRILKRVTAVLLAFSMIAGFMAGSVEVQAAKKITAKSGYNKCQQVKSGKSYLVTSKGYDGQQYYIVFYAPKAGKYQFTLQNLRPHGGSTKTEICNGAACFKAYQHDYEKEPSSIRLDYKDGSFSYYANLCSRYSWGLGGSDKITATTYTPQQKITLKLDKGQAVWIGFNFTKKCDVDLKIKKK